MCLNALILEYCVTKNRIVLCGRVDCSYTIISTIFMKTLIPNCRLEDLPSFALKSRDRIIVCY